MPTGYCTSNELRNPFLFSKESKLPSDLVLKSKEMEESLQSGVFWRRRWWKKEVGRSSKWPSVKEIAERSENRGNHIRTGGYKKTERNVPPKIQMVPLKTEYSSEYYSPPQTLSSSPFKQTTFPFSIEQIPSGQVFLEQLSGFV